MDAASRHLQLQSVQALAAAAADSGDVPLRYIRPELEMEVEEVAVDADGGGTGMPVIDLERLLNPQFARDETAKLGGACREWGIFQLINHGIDEEVIARTKRVTREFFDLPLHEKMQVSIQPDLGIDGFGQHWVLSDEHKMDWCDMLFLTTLPADSRSLRFWPASPASFRHAVEEYSMEVDRVTRCLLNFISDDLAIEREDLLKLFEAAGGPHQVMRLNCYPPCPLPNKVMGLSPHTDRTSVLTILLHVNDVLGLQFLKDGVWHLVRPIPGALVVNVADILQVLTNGTYKSVVHRVVAGASTERLTVAAFVRPHRGCTVGPLAGVVRDGKPRYKSMDYEEYLKVYRSSEFGTSVLETTLKLDDDDL